MEWIVLFVGLVLIVVSILVIRVYHRKLAAVHHDLFDMAYALRDFRNIAKDSDGVVNLLGTGRVYTWQELYDTILQPDEITCGLINKYMTFTPLDSNELDIT